MIEPPVVPDPTVLAGHCITAVEFKPYEPPEWSGFETITVTLEDGRRFQFWACSCCDGIDFVELGKDKA